MQLIPTILCGGAGSRLWPISREFHPKPFIRLQDGQSLLQKAFLRAMNLPNVNEILTITNRELFFKIEDEFAEVEQNNITKSYILEHFGKNTAPAIACGALEIHAKHGNDALMLILTADHLIPEQDLFQNAISQGIELANKDKIVTFGIVPNSPNNAYGYIESCGNDVIRFIEKPTKDKAEEFLKTGSFLWNSGMFLFKAETIINEMQKYCADILEASKNCIALSRNSKGENFNLLELEPKSFSLVPENSIDYALMEKSQEINVVPCSLKWSDLGSWNALEELTEPDTEGNCVNGEAILYDVNNCFIQSHNRLIGAVGLNDIIIVDTPDALLVANKNRAQDVKQLYKKLQSQGHDTHKFHSTVHRPWGTYTILEAREGFKIKRIEVKPGASLSLQMHHHRSEHWVIVTGMAKVTNNEKVYYVNKNESTYIPAGNKHRLENPGILPLIMIEVQSGEYLGEDDIIRFEDTYGRT